MKGCEKVVYDAAAAEGELAASALLLLTSHIQHTQHTISYTLYTYNMQLNRELAAEATCATIHLVCAHVLYTVQCTLHNIQAHIQYTLYTIYYTLHTCNIKMIELAATTLLLSTSALHMCLHG